MKAPSLALRSAATLALTSAVFGMALAPPAGAQFLLDEHLMSVGIDDVAITPDGRYAVARESTVFTRAHVIDVPTGAIVSTIVGPGVGAIPSLVEDGVEVTNDRAVVLGLEVLILDLTATPPNLLTSIPLGVGPRDVAITPDGTLAAVRGGTGVGGGMHIVDLASGSVLASALGFPSDALDPTYTFTVDSVVTSNERAVFTSFVQGTTGPENGRRTRVTIFDLTATPPVVAFETTAATDLLGAPHDLTISPDGLRATVRSDLTVTQFDLGAAPGIAWSSPPAMDPGPFVASAMDSVVATNDLVATISRISNGGVGAQVDVFDSLGNRWFDTLGGDPHDLEITPDETGLVVRTSAGILYYDLANLPAGTGLVPLDAVTLVSSHTSFGAGLDSLSVTDECVVALARTGVVTRVAVYDRDATGLDYRGEISHPDRPVDVAITPDGTRAIVSGTSSASVVDLATLETTFSYDADSLSTSWPWSDGVVTTNDRAIVFGVATFNNPDGWLAALDLFSEPMRYCTANANTSGESATIGVAGSASVGSNDLQLLVSGLPSNVPGFFRVGTSQAQVPFADGIDCIGSPIAYRPATFSSTGGVALRDVDVSNLPVGAAFTPGSTWNFQFLYRDMSANGLNLSDAISVTFEN